MEQQEKNNKIRVCQVSTIPFAVYFLLLNQLKNLKNSGFDVSVACSSGEWKEEVKKEGFFVKEIDMTRKISPFSDLISLLKLFFYFRREKFDIVHTSTPKAGFLGTLAAKAAGVPVIIHSNLGFYFHENTPRIKKILFIWMERIVAACSDLVLSVDRDDIETAKKEKICSKEKIKYLGGWVDMQRFNPQKFSKEFIEKKKKEIGILPDKKIIGIIARLVEEKGYLDLFKAVSILIKKKLNVTLVIVGPREPEKKDRVNPEIVKKFGLKKDKDVIFLGQRTDVEEIYSVMDVFTLPSYREGIGISILEASAMRIPVVATDVRGCREAVDNGKTGILVPVNDPKKLAEAIIFFLLNAEKSKEFGLAGRKKIEKEFNEKLVFEIINIEYKRLIKEKIK